MPNRVRSAWRSLRGRRIFSLAAVGGIAALLLGTLGASTAVAHGIITSGDIKNQTIQSWDIAAGGVGQSEIREDGVDQSEIENQSIRSWNIAAGGVGTSELRNDSVRNEDLSPGVRDQLGAPAAASDPGTNANEPITAQPEVVASLEVPSGASMLVVGSATVATANDQTALTGPGDGFGTCRLVNGNDVLARSSASLGLQAGESQHAALSMSTVFTNDTDGPVTVDLQCAANSGGTEHVNDIALVGVAVSTSAS